MLTKGQDTIVALGITLFRLLPIRAMCCSGGGKKKERGAGPDARQGAELSARGTALRVKNQGGGTDLNGMVNGVPKRSRGK